MLVDANVAIEKVYRTDWGRIVAALIRIFGDFELAEEVAQEAFAAAVDQWRSTGIPEAPRAWLIQAARHKAIDRIRRRTLFAEKMESFGATEKAREAVWDAEPDFEASEIPDDRLRLIFTCCHPALAVEAQVALTLRTLCGLETHEIARAFLVPTATMAQRLVRVICRKCKVETTPDKAARRRIDVEAAGLERVWKGQGCDECRGTGFRGRTGVYELVVMDNELRLEVQRRRGSEELRMMAIAKGMRTLLDDGVRAARAGITTIDEVLRVARA
jgi:RNA polymerase sigma factor (sigma-70 family)